jgi:hypothetical protein
MLDMAQTRSDWFSEVLPVNVTGAMSETAVEQQRIEYTGIFGKEAADALIDQEYYCSFEAAILGAYWGKEILLAEQQGRISDVPVNWELPVQTAWDIGVDDAMAIWCFQVYPDHIDIVDYYEGHGMGFDQYCEWLDERGYHGTDWMPHDAKVREVGAPGARTRIETLFSLGRPELDTKRAVGYVELFASASDQAINSLLDAADASQNLKALDLCCGQGNVSEALLRRGCKVFGIDFCRQCWRSHGEEHQGQPSLKRTHRNFRLRLLNLTSSSKTWACAMSLINPAPSQRFGA